MISVKMSIVELNGVSEIEHEGMKNLNFGAFDAAEINPIDHPIRNGECSFEKVIKLKFTGRFNRIRNIRMWKNYGEYQTGEQIKTNLSDEDYKGDQPFQTPTNEKSKSAIFNLPNTKPNGPNVGIGGKVSNEFYSDEEREATVYSDLIILQMHTTEHTPAGKMNDKGFQFTYEAF